MQASSLPVHVLFVGNASAAHSRWAETFVKQLEAFFPKKVFEAQSLDSAQTLITRIPHSMLPHVVVILGDEGLRLGRHDPQSPENLLVGLYRGLDARLPILKVSEAIPGGELALQEISRGLSAFVREGFDIKDLDVTLTELLTNRFEEHAPRLPRFQVQHKVKLRIASLEQAIVAETLNVGRGGLFVRTLPQDIKVGDLVNFDLNIHQEVALGLSSEDDPITQLSRANSANAPGTETDSIRGQGVVVWVRPQQDPLKYHEGFGLHFTDLDPATSLRIENFVSAHGLKAYIPLS